MPQILEVQPVVIPNDADYPSTIDAVRARVAPHERRHGGQQSKLVHAGLKRSPAKSPMSLIHDAAQAIVAGRRLFRAQSRLPSRTRRGTIPRYRSPLYHQMMTARKRFGKRRPEPAARLRVASAQRRRSSVFDVVLPDALAARRAMAQRFHRRRGELGNGAGLTVENLKAILRT